MSDLETEARQELEEDERTILSVYRNIRDESLFRVYFMDATYLEITGSLIAWAEGFPPADDEEVEPGEAGWEPADWPSLPWDVRDWVQQEIEALLSAAGEELAKDLLSHSLTDQLHLVAERSDLHEWSLAHVLLEHSRRAVLADPKTAADLIEVALHLVRHFDGYDPARVRELRARLFAHRANALRVLGEFRSAGESFRKADACLLDADHGMPETVWAEILSLHASLLREERRFDEARQALAEARALYEREGARPLVARVILKLAKTLEEEGEIEEALRLLAEAEPMLDPRDPRMRLCMEQNRLDFLTKLGRFSEAGMLLPSVHALAVASRADLNLLRLRWSEARILCGMGESERGATLFDEVRRAFMERGMAYDAALVMLDLAVVHLREGRTDELARLAKDILPIFASREIQREAMMALLLFTEAAKENRLSVELVRELAGHLLRERCSSPRVPHPCALIDS